MARGGIESAARKTSPSANNKAQAVSEDKAQSAPSDGGMALAQRRGREDLPRATRVLQTLSELCLIALALLFVTDESTASTWAHSLLPLMVVLAVVLIGLLLWTKSFLLSRPDAGLILGLALGVMLSFSRSHVAKSIITEGEVPQFFEISWAGIAVFVAGALFFAGDAANRFRAIASIPYAPAIAIGTIAAILLNIVLWLAIRRHVGFLEVPPLVGFVTYALEYATLLIIACAPATEWGKRRLGIYCVLALVGRIVLEIVERQGT